MPFARDFPIAVATNSRKARTNTYIDLLDSAGNGPCFGALQNGTHFMVCAACVQKL